MKWTAGAAGALVGAAACGIAVIWVWFAIDAPPKHDNRDWATPLLMLLFAAGAAVVGAAAWGFAAVRLAAGEWRILIAMVVVLALSAALPVVAVASLKGADRWRAHQKAQREKLPAAVAGAHHFDGPQPIDLQSHTSAAPVRVAYRPRPDRRGFGLGVSGNRRAYLLDVDGLWHVTGTVQEAREEAPPPFPCEMDTSQPCDARSPEPSR